MGRNYDGDKLKGEARQELDNEAGRQLFGNNTGESSSCGTYALLSGMLSGAVILCLVLVLLSKVGFIEIGLPREEIVSDVAGDVNDKINVIEDYIGKYYLDEIDETKIADSMYKGIVDGLGDEYAAYYTKDEFKEITETTSGVFCGIGAYVTSDSKTGEIIIVQPMNNSPSKKAGIKPGDIVTEVDGKKVTGEDLSKVTAMIKGEKGTSVKLKIFRKSNNKELELDVKRDNVEEETVNFKMLKNKIAYIQVTGFEEVTIKQFKNAVEKSESENAVGMILDLRNNGGGLLSAAVTMLDRMLPKGLVVYTKNKQGKGEEYYAEDDVKYDKPVVIMVNEYSASASEVFAGAMQDDNAAKLVGTTTFGKGIVQTIFQLDDGTALKMTTSKYYTPKGRNIHGTGLTPDVEVLYDEKVKTKNNNGVIVDNQLEKGIETLEDMIK